MYVKYALSGFLQTQSVLSIEDLLLPGVVHTYTIADVVYIIARKPVVHFYSMRLAWC